jgi:hypothetical protein
VYATPIVEGILRRLEKEPEYCVELCIALSKKRISEALYPRIVDAILKNVGEQPGEFYPHMLHRLKKMSTTRLTGIPAQRTAMLRLKLNQWLITAHENDISEECIAAVTELRNRCDRKLVKYHTGTQPQQVIAVMPRQRMGR